MDLIPEKLTRRYSLVPISRIGNDLVIAISDPTDILAIDDIKTITGCNVEIVLSTRKGIQEALRSFYKTGDGDITELLKEEGKVYSTKTLMESREFNLLDIT